LIRFSEPMKIIGIENPDLSALSVGKGAQLKKKKNDKHPQVKSPKHAYSQNGFTAP
jgi:hypothetical protein